VKIPRRIKAIGIYANAPHAWATRWYRISTDSEVASDFALLQKRFIGSNWLKHRSLSIQQLRDSIYALQTKTARIGISTYTPSGSSDVGATPRGINEEKVRHDESD
jgi:hypothetical protein